MKNLAICPKLKLTNLEFFQSKIKPDAPRTMLAHKTSITRFCTLLIIYLNASTRPPPRHAPALPDSWTIAVWIMTVSAIRIMTRIVNIGVCDLLC